MLKSLHMKLGGIEFAETEPSSPTRPLVLTSPEPLPVLEFVRDHAPELVDLWKDHPLFAIRNTTLPSYPFPEVSPNVSPYWHIDFGSDSPNQWIGLLLANPHAVNTRGATEYHDGSFSTAVLLTYFQELQDLLEESLKSDSILREELKEALGLLFSEAPQVQAFASSRIFRVLQLLEPYSESETAAKILAELQRRPPRALPWSELPHSTGFVSQAGLHRSGVTLDPAHAKPLHRFYIGKRDGIVRASYRIPTPVL